MKFLDSRFVPHFGAALLLPGNWANSLLRAAPSWLLQTSKQTSIVCWTSTTLEQLIETLDFGAHSSSAMSSWNLIHRWALFCSSLASSSFDDSFRTLDRGQLIALSSSCLFVSIASSSSFTILLSSSFANPRTFANLNNLTRVSSFIASLYLVLWWFRNFLLI